MKTNVIRLIILILCFAGSLNAKQRVKKSLVYPPTSLWGLFMAIAIPVDIPELNVFVSYNFESNMHLPINSTEMGDMMLLAPISEITLESRSFGRKLAYSLFEERFKKSGYPGRECVLRSICEAAEAPLNHNGVLGGIMHVILTPSSSKNESLDSEFYLAEKLGYENNCADYVRRCPARLLDSVSKIIQVTEPRRFVK